MTLSARSLPPYLAPAVDRAAVRLDDVRLDVRWYASVASTMDVASEAARSGAPEGLVIIADEQTAGRGRRGRSWSSPPGAGVYLSFVFRPPLDPRSDRLLSVLTLAAGVAVRCAIGHASGLNAELKWPNDLMVGGRKLGGLLAEAVGIGTAAQAVVVGVGVNIANAAHAHEIAARATSLEAELGYSVDRAVIVEEILVALPQTYHRLRRGQTDNILRQWRQAAPSARGSTVGWYADAGWRRGTTAGIDDTGALLIRTSQGIERVISGELRWL